MSPRNSKLSAASILGYSLPVIHDTRKSKIYVDFYAIDPATNEKRRKKMFVSAPTKREAKKRAQELASTITAKLREGWNPWVNESNGRNYALITDVLDRYQDYVERMDRRKTCRFQNEVQCRAMRIYISSLLLEGDARAAGAA